MRLAFSWLDRTGSERELLADCEADATLGQLAAALGVPPEHLSSADADVPIAGGAVVDGAVLGAEASPGNPSLWTHQLLIVSGPGAGTVHRLRPGDYTVGSATGCDIRIDSDQVPVLGFDLQVGETCRIVPAADVGAATRPAPPVATVVGPIVLRGTPPVIGRRVRPDSPLPDGTETLAPDADVPLLHLGRIPVTGPESWPLHTPLALGDVLLELREPTEPDASMSANPTRPTLDFNRPPRLARVEEVTEFTLPNPPRPADNPPFPLLLTLAPAALGVALYLFTHSLMALAFLALSPVLAIGNYLTGRRQNRRRLRRELTEYAERTTRIQADALAALTRERDRRRHDHPDPASTLLICTAPGARLWERRPGDPDFAQVRIGTGDLASEVRVARGSREAHEAPARWTIPDTPVLVDLLEAGVVGLCGPHAERTARAMLGSLAALHSPLDVQVSVLAAGSQHPAGRDWSWAGWLPHLREPETASRFARLPDGDATAAQFTALTDLVRRRSEAGAVTPLHLVVLDGARQLRLLPGAPELLRDGPAVGVMFLCLEDERRHLPKECRVVVGGRAYLSVERSGLPTLTGVRPDAVSAEWALVLARALAPVRDIGGDAVSRLPGASRLLDLIGATPRWSGSATTTAVLGESETGPVRVDLTRDGPHALVAGTTGAGKSELLQTLITSLAMANRPEDLCFVLVDYKGGAAFRECARLPHTVGMVTDLDHALTERALTSLGAELTRRERVLAAAGAKDLADLARGTLPRLVIVIDEFATLAGELPGFVSGLVDVARRGRSLGVHLVLATQRPAGVVSAEIRGNTNLRIALRVTDAADSSDVIDSPRAAQISANTPGRALIRIGQEQLIACQVARVGGPRRHSDPVRLRDLHSRSQNRVTVEDSSELATVVRKLGEAARDLPIPPSPWLPPLPTRLLVDQVPTTPGPLCIGYGLLDEPERQAQGAAYLDLVGSGHLGVIGAPRSGRSTLLRTLAAGVARQVSPDDVHLHCLDFAGNALLPLAGLPHVGAVVTRAELDRSRRLIRRLLAEVTTRQRLLATGGYADLAELRADREALPYLVLMIDGWETFHQTFDALDSAQTVLDLQQLLNAGAAVGIRAVISGDRSLLLGRMAGLLDEKVVLPLLDRADLNTIGVPASRVPDQWLPGRAFRASDQRELQVCRLLDDDRGTAQVAALKALAAEPAHPQQRPFRLDELPNRISAAEADRLPGESGELAVAVGGDELARRGFDPSRDGPCLLICGPRGSGRSSTLLTLGAAARAQGWPVLAFTARISPLREWIAADREPLSRLFDDASSEFEATSTVEDLLPSGRPFLTLVDDLELLDPDGWMATLLGNLIGKLRDTGSLVAVAATSTELGGLYRGPALAAKRCHTGVLLSPAGNADAELFGARLPRSAYGSPVGVGSGWLVKRGQAERVQVIAPPEGGPGA